MRRRLRSHYIDTLQCHLKDSTCGVTAHRMAYFMKALSAVARCTLALAHAPLQDYIGAHQAMEMDQGGSR